MRLPVVTVLALASSAAHGFSASGLINSLEHAATKVGEWTADHFPNNVGFKAMDKGVSTMESTMAKVYFGGQTTQNDLLNGKCGDVMIIFARGTGEPGNVGAFVGPPFWSELTARFPNKQINLQGIDHDIYTGTVSDYLQKLSSDSGGGSEAGAERMALYVNKVVNICQKAEKTQIVLAGWSQGAQVVHKAAEKLQADKDGAKMDEVAAVVTFGDPDKKKAVAGIDKSKVKQICHNDDDICEGIALLKKTHFTYIQETPEAAEFVGSVLKWSK